VPQLDPEVELSTIAADSSTEGYTGADLAALVREASLCALRGVMAGEPGAALVVKAEHFTKALARVRPSVSDAVSIGPTSTRATRNSKTSITYKQGTQKLACTY
jgi:SpoVK/Ycf46/Vps4 family AAA+-type ATPase